MTDLRRYFFIFIVGAVGYCGLEVLWRGFTHPSMAVVGGLCLILIQRINRRFREKPLYLRAALCAVGISVVEFLAGILLNVVLNLNVWDYSAQPFDLLGQVCPLYSVLWFFLSCGVIFFGNKIPYFR